MTSELRNLCKVKVMFDYYEYSFFSLNPKNEAYEKTYGKKARGIKGVNLLV